MRPVLDPQHLSCAPADVTKHAVLGKFNEIRPGVYREFMKDVCEKARTPLEGRLSVPSKTIQSRC